MDSIETGQFEVQKDGIEGDSEVKKRAQVCLISFRFKQYEDVESNCIKTYKFDNKFHDNFERIIRTKSDFQ